MTECLASKQCSSLKVSEIEEEVLKAEAEVRAAELALVMARAGYSATELSGKWEASDIDEDAERIESGKVRFICVECDMNRKPHIFTINVLEESRAISRLDRYHLYFTVAMEWA